jgi:hypothetical protein
MPRITRSKHTRHPLFVSMKSESVAINEDNDCSVIAVAAATGVPYKKVHELMAEHGRKSRDGTPIWATINTVKALGFTMTRIHRLTFINRYPSPHNTLKSVTSYHMARFPAAWQDGNTYLLMNAHHMFCVINGHNIDWSHNKALRATHIWQVKRNSSGTTSWTSGIFTSLPVGELA